MNHFTRTKLTVLILFLSFLLFLPGVSNSQAISEGFNDITTLAASGWVQTNNSSPIGTTGWGQGDITAFIAQSGPTNSYIAANFENTSGTGTISNWLISPSRTINNGDVISFYTRKISPDDYPDRLQVRISLNGTSTNVGTTATSVGDFSTVVLDINPTLITGVYPLTWTLYSVTVSGLPAPTVGRMAFRYFVTGGGPTGLNSDYIGIDNFNYTPFTSTSNDACAGAVNLPVNSTCITTAGDVAGATQSLPAITCGGFTGTANNDVWYKFTATGTTATVNVQGSASFDAVVEVFSGTCAGLTSIGCADANANGGLEVVNLAGLTATNTYYVRVYDYAVGVPATTTFTICVVSAVACTVTIPPSALDENETCGTNSNGGCNAAPNVFTPVACGQTRKGTLYADAAMRDTDWYQFTVTAPTTLTLTAASEVPAVFFVIDNCTLLNALAQMYVTNCATKTLTYNITTPGTYIIFTSTADTMAGAIYNGYPCGANSKYYFTFSLSNPVPTVTPAGSASYCAGSSVMLSASTGSAYVWSNGATTQTTSASTPGSYSVTVTNSNGCVNTSAPVTVSESALPTVSINGNTSVCTATFTMLTANATAGSGTISGYQWQMNGANIGGATSMNYSANQAGNYTVIVTNSNNCSATSSAVTVTISPPPTVNVTGTTTFCSPGSTTLTANATAGAGTISGYQWQLNGNNIGGATNNTYAASQAGNYTVVVTNSNGCSVVSSVSAVTASNAPSGTISGNLSICSGGSTTLNANVTAGTGTITGYQWQLNGTDIGGATGMTYVTSNSGSYTVVVTNSAGCSMTTPPVTVNIGVNPTVSITGNPALCSGSTTTLTASAVAGTGSITNYQWQLNASNIAGANSMTHGASASGGYTVIVTNSAGCTANSSAVIVSTVASPTVTVAGNNTFCSGAFTLLTSTAAAGSGTISGYQWQISGNNINGATSSTYTVTAAGQYTVVVTNSNGCTAASTGIAVTEQVLPTASYLFTVNGSTVTFGNTSQNGTSYSWNFGDASPTSTAANPVHTYTANGTYTVVLTTTNSCGTSTASQQVTVTGVGINDDPSVKSLNIYPNPASQHVIISFDMTKQENVTIEIISVSGQVVHISNDRNIAGKFEKKINLNELASGVYTVRISTSNGVTNKLISVE